EGNTFQRCVLHQAEVYGNAWIRLAGHDPIMGHASTIAAAHELQLPVSPAVGALAPCACHYTDLLRRIIAPKRLVAAADRAVAGGQPLRQRRFNPDVSTMTRELHVGYLLLVSCYSIASGS